MLSAFGQALRKLRIDRQELLRDMAKKLDVSAAFLSSVETGKKKIPNGFCQKVIEAYSLTDEAASDLKLSCEQSAQEIKISLTNASALQRETAISFAKALEGLDEKKLEKILNVVKKKER